MAGPTISNFGTLEANGGALDITSEAITNTGTLQAIDDSVLTLTTLTVSNTGGTVNVDKGSTLDLAGAEIDNGTLTNSGTFDSTGTSKLDNVGITNTGTLQAIDNSVLTLTTLTVTNTGGTVSDDVGSTIDLVSAIINGGKVTNSGTLNSTGTSAISSVISGSGVVTVSGGTLTLSGLNTYGGATTIDSGATLVAGVADALSASSAVTDNGRLDLGTNDQTIASLSGTNTAALVGSFSGSGTGPAVLTISNGGSFAGVIEDGTAGAATALTLTGGTETLTGDNTYSGATTIDGGAKLALSGTGSIANSSGVADSGTFDISATTAGRLDQDAVRQWRRRARCGDADADGCVDHVLGRDWRQRRADADSRHRDADRRSIIYTGATTINGAHAGVVGTGSIATSAALPMAAPSISRRRPRAPRSRRCPAMAPLRSVRRR